MAGCSDGDIYLMFHALDHAAGHLAAPGTAARATAVARTDDIIATLP